MRPDSSPAPRGREPGDEHPAEPDMIDLAFRIAGRQIPVEHAQTLCDAVEAALPWTRGEGGLGIHRIQVAASGNGWLRPEEGTDPLLALSRRTRLVLRMPRARAEPARALEGVALSLGAHRLEVGRGEVRELRPAETLLARSVQAEAGESESDLQARLVQALHAAGHAAGDMVCGREHLIQTVRGGLRVHSLMVTGLRPAASMWLQEYGFGPGRRLGCGLFIPHKGVGQLGD